MGEGKESQEEENPDFTALLGTIYSWSRFGSSVVSSVWGKGGSSTGLTIGSGGMGAGLGSGMGEGSTGTTGVTDVGIPFNLAK